MTSYNGMLATEYEKLPLCSPDFIYLDGPSQFSIKNKINNFSTAHKDIMPIGCDLLKIEYYLTRQHLETAESVMCDVYYSSLK